jgi:hypothetical protein
MHRLFLFLNNGKMALCKTSGTFQAIRWPVLYLQAWQSCRIWNICKSSSLIWVYTLVCSVLIQFRVLLHITTLWYYVLLFNWKKRIKYKINGVEIP